jgi:hypothetical protein
LSTVEGGPNVFLNGFIGRVVADRGAHFLDPREHFLVGKTVKKLIERTT